MFAEFPVCPIFYLLKPKIWNDHFAFSAQSFRELSVPETPWQQPRAGRAGSQTPSERVPGSGIVTLPGVGGCEHICLRLFHSLPNRDTSEIPAGLRPSLLFVSEPVHSNSPSRPRTGL